MLLSKAIHVAGGSPAIAPAGVGDPTATRTVYAIVIALAVIGVVLIGLGIWLIRQTRVDRELLAPLERMAERRWRKLDPLERRRLLDDVRPEGAEPVHPVPTAPEVDEEFEQAAPPVASFDDLEGIVSGAPRAEPGAVAEADPVVEGTDPAPTEVVLDTGRDADRDGDRDADSDGDRDADSDGDRDGDDDPEVYAGDRGGDPASGDDHR